MSDLKKELERQRVKALVEYGGLYPAKLNAAKCTATGAVLFILGFALGAALP